MRRFGPGERIVFLPYSEAVYAKTQAWLQERGLFEVKPPVNYSRLGRGISHGIADAGVFGGVSLVPRQRP